jgi:3-hydroxy-9,10-secoandrosta-1,3,5(10)-triene-9,17-dione monooxygenase reductase component
MDAGQVSFDSGAFRRTMGMFTTGVTIITARAGDGERIGVTANSFSSVSLDPPLVLWSLAKSARSLDAFTEADYFAIHILSAGQEDLSNRFASRGEDKFAGLAVDDGLGGTPLLADCSARLQCRTVYRYEGGDHIIFVGEVVDLVSSDDTPLVFQAGKYALAARKASGEPLVASALVGSEFNEDFLGYLLWRARFQFAAELKKDAAIRAFTDNAFLLLVTLAHNNWRSADSLAQTMFIDGDSADTARALAELEAMGLLERRVAGNGDALVGLNDAGMERALAALAAAKTTEAEFIDKLGLWDSTALKNLLRGFIDATDSGVPHPWVRLEGEASGFAPALD